MTREEAIVRNYLVAVGAGRTLDALDVFSMDARMRDASGHERRGIREIAASFANQEHPVQLEVEQLENDGGAVAVRMRMRFSETRAPRVYLAVFHVTRDRIRSVVMEPVPPRELPSRERTGSFSA